MNSLQAKKQVVVQNIKESKKFYAVFLIILVVGIFLRTWHFHDWLRFSEDEARDATIIDNIITKHESLPLLGPVASVSQFRLGPAYYYIQYSSARIFGNFPVKLAYPDVFFSILAIPLLYLLLKKYFSRNVSLAVAAVWSVSFFIIKYSRFAWNPNSAPFFSILFLYSFLQAADPKTKRKFLWAILTGLALGIGIQLHAVFFLVFPIVFLAALAYSLRKKLMSWKIGALIILIGFLVNTPQIIYEVKSRGANSKAFLAEVFKRDEKGGSLSGKILPSFACQMQANSMILSYFANDNRCNYFLQNERNIENNRPLTQNTPKAYFYAELILSFIFTIGGYFLFILYLKRETEPQRKNFLGLMLLLAVVSVVALTPMIEGVYMRFLLPLAIIPFIILGLWTKLLSEKFKKYFIPILLLIVFLLAAANLGQIKKSFEAFAAKGTSGENQSESMALGEEEFLSAFILRNSQSSRVAYIQGGYEDIFKFIEPARYFFRNRPDLAVKIWEGESQIEPDASYFRVKMIGQDERRVQMHQQIIKNRNVLDKGFFGRFAIFRLDGPLEEKINERLQKQVGK